MLPAQTVRWNIRAGDDEKGWLASAIRVTDGKVDCRLSKGGASDWAKANDITFA